MFRGFNEDRTVSPGSGSGSGPGLQVKAPSLPLQRNQTAHHHDPLQRSLGGGGRPPIDLKPPGVSSPTQSVFPTSPWALAGAMMCAPATREVPRADPFDNGAPNSGQTGSTKASETQFSSARPAADVENLIFRLGDDIHQQMTAERNDRQAAFARVEKMLETLMTQLRPVIAHAETVAGLTQLGVQGSHPRGPGSVMSLSHLEAKAHEDIDHQRRLGQLQDWMEDKFVAMFGQMRLQEEKFGALHERLTDPNTLRAAAGAGGAPSTTSTPRRRELEEKFTKLESKLDGQFGSLAEKITEATQFRGPHEPTPTPQPASSPQPVLQGQQQAAYGQPQPMHGQEVPQGQPGLLHSQSGLLHSQSGLLHGQPGGLHGQLGLHGLLHHGLPGVHGHGSLPGPHGLPGLQGPAIATPSMVAPQRIHVEAAAPPSVMVPPSYPDPNSIVVPIAPKSESAPLEVLDRKDSVMTFEEQKRIREKARLQSSNMWTPPTGMDEASQAKLTTTVAQKPVMSFVALQDLKQESADLQRIKALGPTFGPWYQWWLELIEPERSGALNDLKNAPWFEKLTMTVIMVNAGSIVYGTNWAIENLNQSPPMAMMALEAFFTIYYIVELGIRLLVHKGYFFINQDSSWNCLDFLLVCMSLFDWASTIFKMDSINLVFLRVIRLMRISRGLRALRAVRFFHDLRIILDCMTGSMLPLFWCCLFVTAIFAIFSLIFVQGVTELIGSPSVNELDAETYEGLMTAFGSVQNSMFSLYMGVTGGDDWGNYYALMQLCGPFYAIMYLFYITWFIIAAWNIVTGLFVEQAMKYAAPDISAIAQERRAQNCEDAATLRGYIEVLPDVSAEGLVPMSAIGSIMSDPRIAEFLEVNEVDVKDTEIFFRMLHSASAHTDAETEGVAIDHFVAACLRLKGSATALDLSTLAFETQAMYLVQSTFNVSLMEKVNLLLELVDVQGPHHHTPHHHHGEPHRFNGL
eukprot:TRINITY_DN29096_c0_g1_i1.p1 TRINITY_DN29096_c0_g1~~TRINITY_DN29096_c0_g1_i1.p1  ORF type:complete len:971 (-),score=197.99 TRINITY_DN29096_c0_g1_i1:83-2995(-)